MSCAVTCSGMPAKKRARKVTPKTAAAATPAKKRKIGGAPPPAEDDEDGEEEDVADYAQIMEYAFIETAPTNADPVSFAFTYYIDREQCLLRTEDSILGTILHAHVVGNL